jgi:hypothetical protein
MIEARQPLRSPFLKVWLEAKRRAYLCIECHIECRMPGAAVKILASFSDALSVPWEKPCRFSALLAALLKSALALRLQSGRQEGDHNGQRN